MYVKKPVQRAEYGVSRAQFRNAVFLSGILFLLFLVSAARYEVGNDYHRYEDHFYNIWYGYIVPTEAGFNLTVKTLQFWFGKENYLFLFAFFAFLTVLLMIKAIYRLGHHFAFSFFLFMAFGYYYQSLNTVRYYLALAAAMWAAAYLLRRNHIRFVLTVLIAATFHKSVLVVLPVYFLANCRWKKWQAALLSLIGVSGFFLGDLYLKLILYLYPTYRETMYLEGGTSYINIARCLLVLLFCLFFYREKWRENKELMFCFRLNIGALLLYICGSFIPEVSRIGTYMTVMQVFLLPGVVLSISDERKKKAAAVSVILFAFIYFAAFLYKAYGEYVKLLPYHTWLF